MFQVRLQYVLMGMVCVAVLPTWLWLEYRCPVEESAVRGERIWRNTRLRAEREQFAFEVLRELGNRVSEDGQSVILLGAEPRGCGLLPYLPGLKDLCVATSLEPAHVRSLAQIETLRSLTLQAPAWLSPQALAELKAAQGLHTLVMRDVDLRGRDLGTLAALPRLTVLELPGCELSREQFAAVARVKTLRTLSVQKCRFRATDLEPVTTLRTLDLLDLRGCDVRDEVLPVLEQFWSLRELHFTRANFRQETIASLAQHFGWEVIHPW